MVMNWDTFHTEIHISGFSQTLWQHDKSDQIASCFLQKPGMRTFTLLCSEWGLGPPVPALRTPAGLWGAGRVYGGSGSQEPGPRWGRRGWEEGPGPGERAGRAAPQLGSPRGQTARRASPGQCGLGAPEAEPARTRRRGHLCVETRKRHTSSPRLVRDLSAVALCVASTPHPHLN